MVPVGGPLIRVGFVLAFSDAGWLGGLNYLRSLLVALHSLRGRKVEPVIIVGRFTDMDVFKNFPPANFISTQLFARKSLPWMARTIVLRLTKRDLALRAYLVRHRIDLLSHSGWLHPNLGVPTIGWIPDLQHVHLPEFFSKRLIRERDKWVRDMCEYCSLVQLSSRDAQSHLASLCPGCAAKTRVVHFVAGPPPGFAFAGRDVFERKYGFSGRYLYVPGQFWMHKNHKVVIDALALLKRRGERVLVFATGSATDYRQPGFYDELMRDVESAGVSDMFRVLGVVPYGDVLNLLRHAVAMVNPSRFEGWSTTVEEARSLGKRVMLSDLPVHREQNLARASYFGVDDPDALAEQILACFREYDTAAEERAFELAQAELPARWRAFGEAYQSLVVEAHTGRSSEGRGR